MLPFFGDDDFSFLDTYRERSMMRMRVTMKKKNVLR